MEKYSAYRDSATGIQPFLTPVPPTGSRAVVNATLPIAYLLGVIRFVLVLLLCLLYLFVVEGLCLLLIVIPPLRRVVMRAASFLILRSILFVIGLFWIPTDVISTSKRKSSTTAVEKWSPKQGDVLVSNWVSWIEIVWLAASYNPIFIMPVFEGVEMIINANMETHGSSPITSKPGRRTGTGSANIASPKRVAAPRIPIKGFRQVSLLAMVASSGRVPLTTAVSEQVLSLDAILTKADRPVAIFPECTTSNGRGLLRFADIFASNHVPSKHFRLFILCVRYDPPTPFAPSLSLSVPSNKFNPIPHLFTLCTALSRQPMSIRLLSPSDSPSDNTSLTVANTDTVTEACANLIAQIGKFKRIGNGWEDKAAFLRFYWGNSTQLR